MLRAVFFCAPRRPCLNPRQLTRRLDQKPGAPEPSDDSGLSAGGAASYGSADSAGSVGSLAPLPAAVGLCSLVGGVAPIGAKADPQRAPKSQYGQPPQPSTALQ